MNKHDYILLKHFAPLKAFKKLNEISTFVNYDSSLLAIDSEALCFWLLVESCGDCMQASVRLGPP